MKQRIPAWVPILGGGVILYLLLRPKQAQGAVTTPVLPPVPDVTLPPLETPPAPTGGGGGAAPSTGGTPTQTPMQRLVDRLSRSLTARQVFNIQAAAYSLFLTDAPPDGVFGRETQFVVNRAEDGLHIPYTTGFQAYTLRDVNDYGRAYATDIGMNPRSIPVRLPINLVNLLNADARRVYSNAMLIQTP